MNTNTLATTGEPSYDQSGESAVQTSGSSGVRKVIFAVIWLAVSLPLIWGVVKAWEDVQNAL